MQRLRAAGDLELEPKQAWTNVADFTSRGIDAVNFGPGATRYAHRRDEQVEIAALERAFESLWALRHGYRLTVPVSPILERQTTYPFVRLNEAARRVEERGIEVIDFGMGDPQEPTDPLIREALVDGLRERMGYPAAVGLPELREAIAAWAARRFGVELDPDTEVIPTLGSKEAIFSFALAVVDTRRRPATRSRTPTPAIRSTSAARSSRTRGRWRCRSTRGTASSPTWTRSTMRPGLGSRSSGSTIRTTRPARRRRSPSTSGSPGSRASTGSSSPPTRRTPSSGSTSRPPRRCSSSDLTNVVVFNTLSKRSSMTGYRSGFAAGDPALIGALKAFRPTVGTAPQEFVQRASVVAWGDEEHVERTRERYGRKRALLLGLFAAQGASRRGQRGDDVPLARGARRARHRRRSPSACSSTAFSSRPAPISAPPARATSGRARALGGGVRTCGRDPRGGAVNPELAEEIVAALDSGERRVASKVGDEWVVDVEAKEAILEYFRLRKVEPIDGRAVLLPGQDSAETAAHRASGSFRPGSRATARSSPRASC